MLSIANEVDSLIFCCVYFVYDTNYVFHTPRPLQKLCGDSLNDPLRPQSQSAGIGLRSPTYSLQIIVSYLIYRAIEVECERIMELLVSMRGFGQKINKEKTHFL